MIFRKTLTIAIAALVGGGAFDANAAPRDHRVAPPLTVHHRPFTDAGNVVPVGSESHYVTDSSNPVRTPDYYSMRSQYGAETLPGPFGVLGE